MANTFSFKKVLTKIMKIIGVLDTDTMILDVDGKEKSLATLLSPFDENCVEIKVTVKSEEELEEPTF